MKKVNMNKISKEENYMQKALKLADKAEAIGEIPVGAIVVKDGIIVGRGYNRKERKKDPSSHAEIEAIKKASQKIGEWRLKDCTIYVTLEPCLMCAGAIQQARIEKLVYGADDPKTGAIESILKINEIKSNHKINVQKGVLKKECSEQLKSFFKGLRNEKKNKRTKSEG